MITLGTPYWTTSNKPKDENGDIIEDDNGFVRVIPFTVDGFENEPCRAIVSPNIKAFLEQNHLDMIYTVEQYRNGRWALYADKSYKSTAHVGEYVDMTTGADVPKATAETTVYYNANNEEVDSSEALTNGELNAGYSSSIVVNSGYCTSLAFVMNHFDTTPFSSLRETLRALFEMFFQMHFVKKVLYVG